MSQYDTTKKHLKEKLRKYSKETIINAIFERLEFTTIDLLCHKCFLIEEMKKAEQEEKREMEKLMRFEDAVRKYNGLCKKLEEKGVEGMSLDELYHMEDLLQIIKKG